MVARRPHQKRLSQHSILSRLVAGLLLVFVIYGTTIEAAHRHGRIFNSELSKSTSITSDDDTQGGAGSSRSCAECLICQLHQHFSASLVTLRFKDSPVPTQAEIIHTATHRHQTRAVSTQTGRGPPLASETARFAGPFYNPATVDCGLSFPLISFWI